MKVGVILKTSIERLTKYHLPKKQKTEINSFAVFTAQRL